VGNQYSNSDEAVQPENITNNIDPGSLSVLFETEKSQQKLSFCPQSIKEFKFEKDSQNLKHTLTIVKKGNPNNPITINFNNINEFIQYQNKLRIMLFHIKVLLSLFQRGEDWLITFDNLVNNYFDLTVINERTYLKNLSDLKKLKHNDTGVETYKKHLMSMSELIKKAIKDEIQSVDYKVVKLAVTLTECKYLEKRDDNVILI
jgi:hypothetical protein